MRTGKQRRPGTDRLERTCKEHVTCLGSISNWDLLLDVGRTFLLWGTSGCCEACAVLLLHSPSLSRNDHGHVAVVRTIWRHLSGTHLRTREISRGALVEVAVCVNLGKLLSEVHGGRLPVETVRARERENEVEVRHFHRRTVRQLSAGIRRER